MQLGVGYWGLPAVDQRIVNLIKRKPRHWNKKLKALKRIRRQIMAMPRPKKIVKGWKSYPVRKDRALKMRKLHASLSYKEIGDKFGISRQRVEQIVNSPQWRMYRL
jgi:hypothetical protein